MIRNYFLIENVILASLRIEFVDQKWLNGSTLAFVGDFHLDLVIRKHLLFKDNIELIIFGHRYTFVTNSTTFINSWNNYRIGRSTFNDHTRNSRSVVTIIHW